MRLATLSVLVAASALGPGASAQAAPPLVDAYVRQFVAHCGPGAAQGASLIDQADLNGDGLAEWIVDTNRRACASRPAAFADIGSPVTIFLGRRDGAAIPVFQHEAFGAHLVKTATGRFALWLTVRGEPCGSTDPKSRCDREVIWNASLSRFELAQPAPAKR